MSRDIYRVMEDQKDISILRRLITAKNVNIDTTYGWSPLIHAIYVRWYEGIEYLLSIGANLEERTAGGNTPLSYACYYAYGDEDIKIIQLLISKGCQVDPILELLGSRTNVTPLCEAIKRKKRDVVHLLLDEGADFEKVRGPAKKLKWASNYANQVKSAREAYRAAQFQVLLGWYDKNSLIGSLPRDVFYYLMVYVKTTRRDEKWKVKG